MMWGIRVLRSCLALVVGTAVLVSVPALAAPASAAPATCTTTYSAPGGPIGASPGQNQIGYTFFSVTVPESRVVIDVDYSLDLAFPEAAQFGASLTAPYSQLSSPNSEVRNTASGAIDGVFTFDDEAAGGFAGAAPAPGRYRPTTPASSLDGRAGNGTWELAILSGAPTPGQLRAFTLTLTVDCDADKDGAADQSDNCLIVANPDQSNIDDDALGDACDLDIDGDALANTVDGCPRAAATTKSGCPQVGRTALLRYVKAKDRLKVIVRSESLGCQARAQVTLFRTRPGKDTKLVVATTNSSGRKTWQAPSRAGRYYVKVAKSYAVGQAECGRARSSGRRVP